MVERGRASAMHAPGLFTHGDHAMTRYLSGCEVDVRELGQRISHRIVDCALTYLTAFDVSDGNTQSKRCRGRRQHFITVSDEEQQIRPPSS